MTMPSPLNGVDPPLPPPTLQAKVVSQLIINCLAKHSTILELPYKSLSPNVTCLVFRIISRLQSFVLRWQSYSLSFKSSDIYLNTIVCLAFHMSINILNSILVLTDNQWHCCLIPAILPHLKMFAWTSAAEFCINYSLWIWMLGRALSSDSVTKGSAAVLALFSQESTSHFFFYTVSQNHYYLFPGVRTVCTWREFLIEVRILTW